MSLSTRIRFEILKRDGFTCQYCGRKPPEVQLHVDHIKPQWEGGTDDPENLITSCADCNLGKGRHRLMVVEDCAFCHEEPGTLVTQVGLDKYVWICPECLHAATAALWAAMHPLKLEHIWIAPVRCLRCGTINEAPRTEYRTSDIGASTVNWFCDECKQWLKERTQ
jgi:hypothetical protein